MTACDDTRSKLSALLDNELPPSETVEVQSHLKSCDACTQEWDGLRAVDDQLKDLLFLDNVADKVAAAEQAFDLRPADPATSETNWLRWATIIAAVAASILLAVFALRPREDDPQLPGVPGVEVVARLVRATGSIEMRAPGSDDWATIDASAAADVVKGARLRTGEDVLCEFQTVDEGKIRLNESAELVMHDSRKVELVKGQMWCLAPKEFALDVDVPLQDDAADKIATISCPSASEFQCVAGNSFAACDSVSPQNPPTQWTMGAFSCPVEPGETVSIDAQQKVDRKLDPNSATKIWQLPLLAVGTKVDQELVSSLEFLLAPIGMSKARHLNEEQIRRLGPKGALPLLAFVRSEASPDQLRVRRTAISIAADLADERAIGMLQDIKSDPDQYISRRAADALKRIAEQAQ